MRLSLPKADCSSTHSTLLRVNTEHCRSVELNPEAALSKCQRDLLNIPCGEGHI